MFARQEMIRAANMIGPYGGTWSEIPGPVDRVRTAYAAVRRRSPRDRV